MPLAQAVLPQQSGLCRDPFCLGISHPGALRREERHIGIEWLADELVAACVESKQTLVQCVVTGNEDHRHAQTRLAQTPTGLVTVACTHFDIEQHHVGFGPPRPVVGDQLLQCGLTASRLSYQEVAVEGGVHRIPYSGVVIDHPCHGLACEIHACSSFKGGLRQVGASKLPWFQDLPARGKRSRHSDAGTPALLPIPIPPLSP